MLKKIIRFLSIFYITTLSLYPQNKIIIDLSKQRLTVIDRGQIKLVSPISSGNKFHPTPTGKFKIFQKDRFHKSSLYPIRPDGKRGGANMDYMLKFTSAIAIHEGNVVYENGKSVPASHGCIRVPKNKAKRLFAMINKGTPVKVIGKANFKNNYNKMINKNDTIFIPGETIDFGPEGYIDTGDIEDFSFQE